MRRPAAALLLGAALAFGLPGPASGTAYDAPAAPAPPAPGITVALDRHVHVDGAQRR